MISDFDIKRISLGGSVFDLHKLRWLSGKYIRENYTPESLYRKMGNWRLNNQFFTKIMPLMIERMDTLSDFMPKCSFFWAGDLEYDPALLVPKKKTPEETIKILQTMTFLCEREIDWNAKTIEKIIRHVFALWDWKARDLTGVLFVAISGKKVAPPLFESMELLGINICRYRLVQAIEKLGGISKDALKNLEKEIQEREAALLQATQESTPKTENA